MCWVVISLGGPQKPGVEWGVPVPSPPGALCVLPVTAVSGEQWVSVPVPCCPGLFRAMAFPSISLLCSAAEDPGGHIVSSNSPAARQDACTAPQATLLSVLVSCFSEVLRKCYCSWPLALPRGYQHPLPLASAPLHPSFCWSTFPPLRSLPSTRKSRFGKL